MRKKTLLIKYGGNAMQNEKLQNEVIAELCKLKAAGLQLVLVHGGGPFIEDILQKTGIRSEFLDGHRKTSPEALKYIEMALKGEVNSKLVNVFNIHGQKAVGLSGKDGATVVAKKRWHYKIVDGKKQKVDLGRVGDIHEINTELIKLLLKHDFIPVITCIASDAEGNDYNINADMFAGNLAGALKADNYLVLTDVDGLMEDIKKPDSLIKELKLNDIDSLYGSVIMGGMIPKIESCTIALKTGAQQAGILNGTKPKLLSQKLLENKITGTDIKK